MLYAVIETGGKQYRVEEGMLLEHEVLDGLEVSGDVEFDEVLLVVDEDGPRVGTPHVEGARVKGTVRGVERGQKIIVYKYKDKEGYRRKRGHRQMIMTTEITAIEA